MEKILNKLKDLIKDIDPETLRIPKYVAPPFEIVYEPSLENSTDFIPNENSIILPASAIVKASLLSAKKLSTGDDVKNTLELTFHLQDEIPYEPGDSFGFLCPNNSEEVKMLLERLNIVTVADSKASLLNHSSSSTYKLPKHLPSFFTIRYILLHNIEIRAVPKKVLLRILADYTQNKEEKLCLLFLSSNEGSKFYTDLIRNSNLAFIDILFQFPLCNPPIEILIEHLPPLKPRFYSVANSPLYDKSTFKIVFNVIKFELKDGRSKEREGVCTGWLNELSHQMLCAPLDIAGQLSSLTLSNNSLEVYVYKRCNQHFVFPKTYKDPIIMVGPGTGIGPFVGYLQHRERLLQKCSDKHEVGETWLFYGCRYQERDFLYRNELNTFVKNGTLAHLIVSFSRDKLGSASRYVHENIKMHHQQISTCLNSGGRIFVCGDARNMMFDVRQAFIEAYQCGSGVTEIEAKTYIKNMEKEYRYVNDVWA